MSAAAPVGGVVRFPSGQPLVPGADLTTAVRAWFAVTWNARATRAEVLEWARDRLASSEFESREAEWELQSFHRDMLARHWAGRPKRGTRATRTAYVARVADEEGRAAELRQLEEAVQAARDARTTYAAVVHDLGKADRECEARERAGWERLRVAAGLSANRDAAQESAGALS